MIKKCPACSGPPKNRIIATRTGTLSECSVCGTLWKESGPTFSSYGEKYFRSRGHYGEHAGVRSAKLKSFIGFWRCAQASPGANALEVGCATGWGLIAGRELGYRMRGLDVAEESALSAEKMNFPPNTVVDSLDKLACSKFSLVGFFDALEHIPNPEKFMFELKEYLSPGATIVIVLPCASSFSRTLLGSFWPHYLPDHWVHFSQSGFPKFAEACGYELVSKFKPIKYVTPFTLFQHLFLHCGIKIPAPAWPVFRFNIGQAGYIIRPMEIQ